RHPAHLLGDERAEDFDHAVEKTGHQPDLPRPDGILGLEINRQHDEKHEREKTHGVDAVGQRRHVLAPALARQPARLPGVEKIAEENRDRRAGKNPPENIFVGQMNQLAAQTDDQNELNQIVDHQPEKPVEILAHEPGRLEGGLRHERNFSAGNFPATVAAAVRSSQTGTDRTLVCWRWLKSSWGDARRNVKTHPSGTASRKPCAAVFEKFKIQLKISQSPPGPEHPQFEAYFFGEMFAFAAGRYEHAFSGSTAWTQADNTLRNRIEVKSATRGAAKTADYSLFSRTTFARSERVCSFEASLRRSPGATFHRCPSSVITVIDFRL